LFGPFHAIPVVAVTILATEEENAVSVVPTQNEINKRGRQLAHAGNFNDGRASLSQFFNRLFAGTTEGNNSLLAIKCLARLANRRSDVRRRPFRQVNARHELTARAKWRRGWTCANTNTTTDTKFIVYNCLVLITLSVTARQELQGTERAIIDTAFTAVAIIKTDDRNRPFSRGWQPWRDHDQAADANQQ